jgi:hypothetical protein
MIRRHFTPVALAIFVAAGPSAVSAQIGRDSAADTVISLGGRQIMNIRTGAGGYTAQQRADAVRERLVPILSIISLTPEDVSVRQQRPGQDAGIYVRGHLLVTVDRTLARTDGMSPFKLADKWAARLASVLPQVDVRLNRNGI